MFCSTIIPTVGRDSLSRSVESVLGQDFPEEEFEVIVVNDSGSPLPAAEWQNSDKVKSIDTNRTERSVARNTGAAAARGRYLHFLDDDDWILPGAFSHFYELAKNSPAAWLYGSTQLLDRQGNPLIRLTHGLQGNIFVMLMAGEWIPLQSSLIETSSFMKVGGFLNRLNISEDVDLARRIGLFYEFSSLPEVVACIGMGNNSSTSDYDSLPEFSRQARELILEEVGVFNRLFTSATSSEWLGRIPRIYLTSMLWNFQRLRFFTGFSRGAFAMLSMVLARKSLFTSSFWNSMLKQYDSVTFARGFQEAEKRKVGSTV
jgi:glycosyltransferase involved in cell wall biosynthesis